MISRGFLIKVRLCLCLLPSILLSSCSLFHNVKRNVAEQNTSSLATLVFYSPANDQGKIIETMSILCSYGTNPKIQLVQSSQPSLTEVQLSVHDKQELEHIISGLVCDGIIIQTVRYNP